jgi:hypothetical protein
MFETPDSGIWCLLHALDLIGTAVEAVMGLLSLFG